MGLFDKMKQATAATGGNQTVTFTFQALPESPCPDAGTAGGQSGHPLQDRSPHRLRAVRLRCPTRTSERKCSTGCGVPVR